MKTTTPVLLPCGGSEELQEFLDMLNTDPETTLDKTYVTINPHSLNPTKIGQKEATAIRHWWLHQETRHEMHQLFICRRHKIAGEKVDEGDWFSECLGNCWCDVTINGRRCHLTFYARTSSPNSFINDREGRIYAISIEPIILQNEE